MRIDLILHLARRDLTDRFSGSALGSLWTLIQPLVMVVVFTVIFANIMAARMPVEKASAWSFGIYLMCGLVPWTAFSNTCLRTATLFSDRKAMIQQADVDLAVLPVYLILAESATWFITTLILVVFTVISGDFAGWALLAVPVVFLAQQILAYGIGLALATFTVFLPDLKEFATIVFQLLFWFTPIVYIITIVPEPVRSMVEWNPASAFIQSYHAIFMLNEFPRLVPVLATFAIGGAVLAGAWLTLRKLERDVRDFL